MPLFSIPVAVVGSRGRHAAVRPLVEPRDQRRRGRAWPFRLMRCDFTAISYERVLAQDHVEPVGMPPAEASREELTDVDARHHESSKFIS